MIKIAISLSQELGSFQEQGINNVKQAERYVNLPSRNTTGIEIHEFNNQGEVDAFVKGLNTMEGWMGYPEVMYDNSKDYEDVVVVIPAEVGHKIPYEMMHVQFDSTEQMIRHVTDEMLETDGYTEAELLDMEDRIRTFDMLDFALSFNDDDIGESDHRITIVSLPKLR